MQHIYRHRDEQFEVYTTVFSPQVSRSRSRTRHEDKEDAGKVVVVMRHRSNWQRELDLNHGDQIQVLFKEDQAWWFGRMQNGNEGFFPAACVEPLQDEGSGGSVMRRGSVPVAGTTEGPICGRTSGCRTPKLLRTNRSGGSADPPHQSSNLLLRVLTKSRRKSCPHLSHPPLSTGSINTAFPETRT